MKVLGLENIYGFVRLYIYKVALFGNPKLGWQRLLISKNIFLHFTFKFSFASPNAFNIINPQAIIICLHHVGIDTLIPQLIFGNSLVVNLVIFSLLKIIILKQYLFFNILALKNNSRNTTGCCCPQLLIYIPHILAFSL